MNEFMDPEQKYYDSFPLMRSFNLDLIFLKVEIMKLNKLKDSLVGLAIVLFFNGCNSLDISNLWNYDAELVWNDDNLATAYVTDLYGDIFKGWDTGIIRPNKTDRYSFYVKHDYDFW